MIPLPRPTMVNGQVMRIFQLGSGNKTILFLHGLFETSAYWLALAEDLSQKGFKCIVFDMRAHGLTFTTLGSGMAISNYVDDVVSIDKNPYAIIGHSWGGVISQKFAQEYQPDKLILCNTTSKTPKIFKDVHDELSKMIKVEGIEEKLPILLDTIKVEGFEERLTIPLDKVKGIKEKLTIPIDKSTDMVMKYSSMALKNFKPVIKPYFLLEWGSVSDIIRNSFILREMANGDFYDFNLVESNKNIKSKTLTIVSTNDEIMDSPPIVPNQKMVQIEGGHILIHNELFNDTIKEFVLEV